MCIDAVVSAWSSKSTFNWSLSPLTLGDTRAITAWGDPVAGGVGEPAGLGFTAIASTSSAFAALSADGTIIA